MKINILRKLSSSLFLKIIIIFFVAILLIHYSMRWYHRKYFGINRFYKIQNRNVNYAKYILKDISVPPDTTNAQKLADSLQIKIRYKGPDFEWTSKQPVPDFDDVTLYHYKKDSTIEASFSRFGFCVKINKNDHHFLFVLVKRKEGMQYAAELHRLFVYSVVVFTLFLIYLSFRWLLHPITVLHRGVKELSKGNLDYEVTTKRSDELGTLIRSLNFMARRIREMIHARDQLLLDVSHELRSPLTRTKVTLELLEDSQDKKDISEDVCEMETMITEILETERLKSQYGEIQLKKENIFIFLQNVISEYSNKNPGIRLFDIPEKFVFNADLKRLKILFKNILDNATKYSNKNGTEIEIKVEDKKSEIVISIQDFGCGIPEDDLPFIFEPFYRVDKSRCKETGGYGLGMNLCKKIMEAHHGKIEVKSEVNKGTTVFLRFFK